MQAGARPLESAVDRFDGRVQHSGNLLCLKSEDVAQDEDGQLARRQELKRSHEGERDGFGLLVASLRSERHGNRTFEEGVGKWLEPYDLSKAGRFRRFNPGNVPLLGWSSSGR